MRMWTRTSTTARTKQGGVGSRHGQAGRKEVGRTIRERRRVQYVLGEAGRQSPMGRAGERLAQPPGERGVGGQAWSGLDLAWTGLVWLGRADWRRRWSVNTEVRRQTPPPFSPGPGVHNAVDGRLRWCLASDAWAGGQRQDARGCCRCGAIIAIELPVCHQQRWVGAEGRALFKYSRGGHLIGASTLRSTRHRSSHACNKMQPVHCPLPVEPLLHAIPCRSIILHLSRSVPDSSPLRQGGIDSGICPATCILRPTSLLDTPRTLVRGIGKEWPVAHQGIPMHWPARRVASKSDRQRERHPRVAEWSGLEWLMRARDFSGQSVCGLAKPTSAARPSASPLPPTLTLDVGGHTETPSPPHHPLLPHITLPSLRPALARRAYPFSRPTQHHIPSASSLGSLQPPYPAAAGR